MLVDTDLSVKRAGGALVQLLPFADEEVGAKIEENAHKMRSVTSILLDGGAEDILKEVFDGLEYDVFDTIECAYKCVCSREKTDAALISLGSKELEDMLSSDEETVISCGFCDKVYKYSKSDLKGLIAKCKK